VSIGRSSLGVGRPARLCSMSISHPSRAARLMLEHKGID
jgi:hypothetical protein